jgi:hypothetical protein
MGYFNQTGIGTDAKGVFDCACTKKPRRLRWLLENSVETHSSAGSHPPHGNIVSGKFSFLAFTGKVPNQHIQYVIKLN